MQNFIALRLKVLQSVFTLKSHEDIIYPFIKNKFKNQTYPIIIIITTDTFHLQFLKDNLN